VARKQRVSVEIPFSVRAQDQRNLSKVGGYIAIKENGKTVFKFDTIESYEKYLELQRGTSA